MRLFAVGLFLALWLAHAGLGRAQSNNITGVLQSIDVKIGTITILHERLGVKKARTLSLLRPDIEVMTKQGRIRIEDLGAGNVVQLQLDDQEDVAAVRVELPAVRGALMALDLPGRSLRMLAEDLTDRVATVSGNTKIVHGKKEVGLGDLQVYQWLEITASLDGKSALAIEAHAPGTRNGRVSSGRLDGSIVLLDVKSGAVLFHNKKGRERLLTFAAPRALSTWVLFDDRPVDKLEGPLALASMPATVYLTPDRRQVGRILVEAPLLRCRIDAVDIEKRRLTVSENGATRTWDLPVDVKVMNGTRRGKAEDLRADTAIDLVLSLDRARLHAIVLANPP